MRGFALRRRAGRARPRTRTRRARPGVRCRRTSALVILTPAAHAALAAELDRATSAAVRGDAGVTLATPSRTPRSRAPRREARCGRAACAHERAERAPRRTREPRPPRWSRSGGPPPSGSPSSSAARAARARRAREARATVLRGAAVGADARRGAARAAARGGWSGDPRYERLVERSAAEARERLAAAGPVEIAAARRRRAGSRRQPRDRLLARRAGRPLPRGDGRASSSGCGDERARRS